MEEIQAKLVSGCSALGLTLSDLQHQQLLDYIALLKKWNKAYNLTAVRDPVEMVSKHLLDSLAILPYIQGNSVLDVGTGAGLPGVPLAIAAPTLSVTLLDSNAKKTRFLQQVKAELGLDNVIVVQGRVEHVDVEQTFDTVTARAFASVDEVIRLAGRHGGEEGHLVLMLGQANKAISVGNRIAEFEVVDVQALQVPDLAGARHIAKLIRREN